MLVEATATLTIVVLLSLVIQSVVVAQLHAEQGTHQRRELERTTELAAELTRALVAGSGDRVTINEAQLTTWDWRSFAEQQQLRPTDGAAVVVWVPQRANGTDPWQRQEVRWDFGAPGPIGSQSSQGTLVEGSGVRLAKQVYLAEVVVHAAP